MLLGEEREVVAAVGRRGFLARLPPELAAEITARAPLVHYPEGSVSFLNRDGGSVAVVVSGMLRYYLPGEEGRQLTIRYVGPGDLVGSVTRQGSGLSTAIQAIEPSNLLHLDVKRLQAIADREAALSTALLEEMAGRLRAAYRSLAASAFGTVRSRIARDLVERARASGQLQRGAHLQVTQQALADAIGSVREVVARTLRELRQEGAVASDHSGLTLLDPDALTYQARGMARRSR